MRLEGIYNFFSSFVIISALTLPISILCSFYLLFLTFFLFPLQSMNFFATQSCIKVGNYEVAFSLIRNMVVSNFSHPNVMQLLNLLFNYVAPNVRHCRFILRLLIKMQVTSCLNEKELPFISFVLTRITQMNLFLLLSLSHFRQHQRLNKVR